VSTPQNYDEIERLLSESRGLTEPAEAHGTLVGALCASASYGVDDWLGEILPEGAAPAARLRTLFKATRDALVGSEMQFTLLMPGDERPLEQRTEALALWCNGFVYGLGQGGTADPERLPGDVGEIVRDLAEIMRAGVDTSAGSEDNEVALAELVEYVRVGVQVVYEELAPARAPVAAARALH
jgi:uncharacterized protein YgfB (UPF0149 family)